MVKPAEKRIAKYSGKIDADVVRSRIASLKDSMVETAQVRQSELADIQSSVKSILEERGVIPELTVIFMKVGAKLYGLSLKHSGLTFENEAKAYLDLVYAKYNGVFKTTFPLTAILQDIANLFGVTWTPPA